MTPVSFVKLTLRLIVAGFVFVALPSSAILVFMSVTTQVTYGDTANWPGLVGVILTFVVMILLLLLVWFRAVWLARFLLPAGTSGELSADYDQWQRAGLTFIGGWMALKACLGLEAATTTMAMIDPILTPFYLIAAIILIFGWNTITGMTRRFFRTNWFALVMSMRRRYYDRPGYPDDDDAPPAD